MEIVTESTFKEGSNRTFMELKFLCGFARLWLFWF